MAGSLKAARDDADPSSFVDVAVSSGHERIKFRSYIFSCHADLLSTHSYIFHKVYHFSYLEHKQSKRIKAK